MSESTAVTTTERKGVTALLLRDEARARITPMLRGVEYERVVGEVYLAVAENPKILECTQASIIRAVARACGWGLEIGRTVHLVPFNVNAGTREDPKWEQRLQAIRDYKGDIELITATGAAKSIRAQVVYEKEMFEYVEGDKPMLRHGPARTVKERGPMIGAYAIADHGYNRPPHIVYLPLDDINFIRQKYSKQWKSGDCPPWYARKTAVKQLAKMLPMNPKLAKVLASFDQEEDPNDTTDALEGAPVATIPAGETEQRSVENDGDRDLAGQEESL